MGLRNLTTLALLGILSVPPHWCCFVAWGVHGGPECCRSQVPLELVAADDAATSPCCRKSSARDPEVGSAWRREPTGQLPCACCTQIREAISKESSAWNGNLFVAPSAMIMAPSLYVASDFISAAARSPNSARPLQITLCRWLC